MVVIFVGFLVRFTRFVCKGTYFSTNHQAQIQKNYDVAKKEVVMTSFL